MAQTFINSGGGDQFVSPTSRLPVEIGGGAGTGGNSTTNPLYVWKAPSATATKTAVTATITATDLLAANANRKGATIYYDGAAILYLLEGAGTPSSTNFTYKLGQGYYTAYEAPESFTGLIRGVWSAVVGQANVTERTA